MAHAQKPDFVFPRNGRVHSNRWGRQFSRLLAGEVCASALVMLDIPRSEVAWEYWLLTPFASFPFISPPVRHRVPPVSERALHSGNIAAVGGFVHNVKTWIRLTWIYWVTVISEDFSAPFGVQIQCFGDGSKETVWCGQYTKHAHTTCGMVMTPTCIMPLLTSRLLIANRNARQMISGPTGRADRVE